MQRFLPEFSISENQDNFEILIAEVIHIHLTQGIRLDNTDEAKSKIEFEIPSDYYSAPELSPDQLKERDKIFNSEMSQAMIESENHRRFMIDEVFQGSGSDDERDVYGF